MDRPQDDSAVVGNLYPRVPALAPNLAPITSPSPMPTVAELESADWTTETIVQNSGWQRYQMNNLPQQERRHSGWEEVERQWMRQNGAGNSEGGGGAGSQQLGEPQLKRQRTDNPVRQDGGNAIKAKFQVRHPHIAIPAPNLEPDFRMKVTLNSQSATMAVVDGYKEWTTFTDGVWSGEWGCGVVMGGGQDSQDLVHGRTSATQVEATHRLRTADEPPAYIECKTKGYMTGPPDVLHALQDPDSANVTDPRSCRYNVFVSMKTTDERYAENVNMAMWVGSGVWKGLEIIYEAYRIT